MTSLWQPLRHQRLTISDITLCVKLLASLWYHVHMSWWLYSRLSVTSRLPVNVTHVISVCDVTGLDLQLHCNCTWRHFLQGQWRASWLTLVKMILPQKDSFMVANWCQRSSYRCSLVKMSKRDAEDTWENVNEQLSSQLHPGALAALQRGRSAGLGIQSCAELWLRTWRVAEGYPGISGGKRQRKRMLGLVFEVLHASISCCLKGKETCTMTKECRSRGWHDGW